MIIVTDRKFNILGNIINYVPNLLVCYRYLIKIINLKVNFMKQKKRKKKMTEETKDRNRRTIFRFIQGVVVGVLAIMLFFRKTRTLKSF